MSTMNCIVVIYSYIVFIRWMISAERGLIPF